MAIVAEGSRGRVYLPPTAKHTNAAQVERPEDVPDTELPDNPRNCNAPIYGLSHHADLFTNRQLVALTTFSDLVRDAHDHVRRDAGTAGMAPSDAEAYADAVATYLAFAVDKSADYWSSLNGWDSSRDSMRNVFGRQAIRWCGIMPSAIRSAQAQEVGCVTATGCAK